MLYCDAKHSDILQGSSHVRITCFSKYPFAKSWNNPKSDSRTFLEQNFIMDVFLYRYIFDGLAEIAIGISFLSSTKR